MTRISNDRPAPSISSERDRVAIGAMEHVNVAAPKDFLDHESIASLMSITRRPPALALNKSEISAVDQMILESLSPLQNLGNETIAYKSVELLLRLKTDSRLMEAAPDGVLKLDHMVRMYEHLLLARTAAAGGI